MTPARSTIARMVHSFDVAFTVEDLAAAVARTSPASGAIATVYRAVNAMEQAGFIERVGRREGSALYIRCGAGHHHHHIVCEGCGKVSEADCPIAGRVDPAGPEGFVVTRHEVTIYGLCPRCAGKGVA